MKLIRYNSKSSVHTPQKDEFLKKVPTERVPEMTQKNWTVRWKEKSRVCAAWVKENGKVYAIETGANLAYWSPVLGIAELTFMGYPPKQAIALRVGNVGYALLFSKPYLWVLDHARKYLNPAYYHELVGNIPREKSLRTKLWDYTVDTMIQSTFWTALFVPILKFINHLSWEQIAVGSLKYTAVYFVTGRLFGKFIDYVRKKTGIQKKEKATTEQLKTSVEPAVSANIL